MDYRNPDAFRDRRVIVVGGGNSAVQIAVELAGCARVTLATRQPVRFMPQRVLGRDIHFWLGITGLDRCRWWSDQSAPVMDCGQYREALASDRPPQRRLFLRYTADGVVWPDGTSEPVEDVIFATGYRTEYPFLKALACALPHRRGVSLGIPGLYFVGLSGQTGLASATLRGVGRDAAEVVRALRRRKEMHQTRPA
jgi:putative flavoprotein involved in K+ transport